MSFSRLPEKVQVNIFLRLPVISIGSCRCVSKAWCSQLYNPSFIKNHLNHNIKNNKHKLNKLLVIPYDPDRSPSHVIDPTDYASILSRTPKVDDFPFHYNKNDRADILGSSNGLICLCFYPTSYAKDNISMCVWNPCTRECKKISTPMHKLSEYGFGYDSNTDDHKLVCISASQVMVYTLRSDSWKSTPLEIPNRFPTGSPSTGLLFNGALHWSCHNERTSNPVIVSFDINDEKLMELPFPEPYDKRSFYNTRLGVFEDCLCLFASKNLVDVNIWVMHDYGVKGTWTQRFTTTAEIPFSYCYFEPTWSFKNGEMLVKTHGRFFLMNPRNGGLIMTYG